MKLSILLSICMNNTVCNRKSQRLSRDTCSKVMPRPRANWNFACAMVDIHFSQRPRQTQTEDNGDL